MKRSCGTALRGSVPLGLQIAGEIRGSCLARGGVISVQAPGTRSTGRYPSPSTTTSASLLCPPLPSASCACAHRSHNQSALPSGPSATRPLYSISSLIDFLPRHHLSARGSTSCPFALYQIFLSPSLKAPPRRTGSHSRCPHPRSQSPTRR